MIVEICWKKSRVRSSNRDSRAGVLSQWHKQVLARAQAHAFILSGAMTNQCKEEVATEIILVLILKNGNCFSSVQEVGMRRSIHGKFRQLRKLTNDCYLWNEAPDSTKTE